MPEVRGVKGGERRELCERGWCVGRDSPKPNPAKTANSENVCGRGRCDARDPLMSTQTPPAHHTTTQALYFLYSTTGPHLVILRGSQFVGQEQPAPNITRSNLYGRSKSTYAASKPYAAASPHATMKDNQRVLRHLHYTQRQSTRLILRHAMGSPSPRQILAKISWGGCESIWLASQACFAACGTTLLLRTRAMTAV